MTESYDVVCIGSGFASSFFLEEYLRHARANARVLVLERGPDLSHQDRIEKRNDIPLDSCQDTYRNLTPAKQWLFTLGRGGSSNCWTGNTPRQIPSDFRMQSLYGVACDWPLGYDDLEPYYCEVEETFGVAGPDDALYDRSQPYPCPPHVMNQPDRALARAHPGLFFAMPVAKPTRARGHRPACCASLRCHLCPVDSKFTILNGMRGVYADPRVALRTDARAERITHAGGVATGVDFTSAGREHHARTDFVVLGANALFNPHLLLKSDLSREPVGQGLCEQVGVRCHVDLEGMDGFQGSTLQTSVGYTLYDGPHRRDRAAALIEGWNVPRLRNERGRWRERYALKFVFEDLPRAENRVTLDSNDEDRPVVEFHGPSPYTERGIAALRDSIEQVLAPLPVESYVLDEPVATEYHIQCTTPMGVDPAVSVVDENCLHHEVRNLAVVGSSVFPTSAPANPTLTLAAIAVRSARTVFAGGST